MRSRGINWVVLCGAGAWVACAQTDNTEQSVADTAATAGTEQSAAGTEPMDTLHVELREWSVAPQQDTIQAGTVVFHVMNQGEYEHALEVEGGGKEEETDRIGAGGTATLTMQLEPGNYELYCPVEDSHGKHEELGMRTSLVVVRGEAR